MPLFLRESDVHQLLTMDDALAAVEEAFRRRGTGEADNWPRQRPKAGRAFLQVMPAAVVGVGMGLKAYTVARGQARFVVLLWNDATGDLEAVIEADKLGQMRTGAASGVATKVLARADAETAGLFGSGWQAASQLEAICKVRPIRQAWVYSRSPERRERFALEMGERLGVAVTAVDEPRRAVDEADIVATITTASEPVFDGTWLRPGTHLNVAGSNRPRAQEVDVETVRRASFIAIDDKAQGQSEAGDLLVPIAAEVLSWDDVAELGDVVAGKVQGRAGDADITLFKSLGVALEDVAVARVVVDKARAAGLGEPLPETELG